jgi:hypothetical protein
VRIDLGQSEPAVLVFPVGFHEQAGRGQVPAQDVEPADAGMDPLRQVADLPGTVAHDGEKVEVQGAQQDSRQAVAPHGIPEFMEGPDAHLKSFAM